MKIIDTDILIDHFHGNEAERALSRALLAIGVCISVATVAEILACDHEEENEALLHYSMFTQR
jgi:predicted nucleic acid-binding protein